jgi:hypothetical protein
MRWGDGFEIETILNVRAAKAGLRIVEVPSVEQPRLYGESKLNAVRDGLRILRVIGTEYVRTPVFSADPATQPAGEPAWEPEGVKDPDLHGAPIGQREPEEGTAAHRQVGQDGRPESPPTSGAPRRSEPAAPGVGA